MQAQLSSGVVWKFKQGLQLLRDAASGEVHSSSIHGQAAIAAAGVSVVVYLCNNLSPKNNAVCTLLFDPQCTSFYLCRMYYITDTSLEGLGDSTWYTLAINLHTIKVGSCHVQSQDKSRPQTSEGTHACQRQQLIHVDHHRGTNFYASVYV